MAFLLRFVRDEHASNAVEFALVIPIFLALVFSLLNISMILYCAVTLHYAAEDGARCFAVNSATCPSATAAQAYAKRRYGGPTLPGLAFTATQTGACSSASGANNGYNVTASGTFTLLTGFVKIAVPLSTKACFPSNSSST